MRTTRSAPTPPQADPAMAPKEAVPREDNGVPNGVLGGGLLGGGLSGGEGGEKGGEGGLGGDGGGLGCGGMAGGVGGDCRTEQTNERGPSQLAFFHSNLPRWR